MRLATSRRRLFVYGASACFVVLFLLKLRSVGLLMSSSSRSSNKKMPIEAADCSVSEALAANLHTLMADTDTMLDKLRLTHTLCYGTLWGWLKMERLLPWERNVEFCVLNDELAKHDEAFLIRAFRRSGLSLTYDSRDGVYEVRSMSAKLAQGEDVPLLRLVVFERDAGRGDTMRRIGWTRRVLPPDCDLSPSLHCFPARLLEHPLPTVVIDDVRYEVPREEVEIQKYHYPNTWWEDVRPADC